MTQALKAANSPEAVRDCSHLREKDFQILANSIPQLAWMADSKGWIFWYNQRWYDYTGTTLSDMEGWGWTKVHHPDYVDRAVENFAHAVENGLDLWEDTFPIRRHDGEYRWFLSRAYPLRNENGDVIRWFGTNTDITENLRSEDVFRQMIDAMPQMIWVSRPDGYHEYLNQRWQEFTGISPTDMNPYKWENVTHPDDIAGIAEKWEEALRTGNPYSNQYRLKRHDGEYCWVLGRAIAMRNDQGEIIKWYGTCTDIDLQKKTEQALIEARNRAEDANRAKGEFLANMSHEIRTPMNAILGIADILQHQNITANQQYKLLNTLQASAKHLLGIINDVLDFAKLEQHAVELLNEDFDLYRAIENVAGFMRIEADRNDLYLVTEYTGLSPRTYVHGDSLRIQQVLTNLIGNAIKFTRIGGVRIVTEAQDEGACYDVCISIIDTGIGIPEEKCDLIFDKFTQANNTTTRMFGGTGLGLPISRSLIDLMDGSIAVKSELGFGSTFTIRLKLPKAAVDPDHLDMDTGENRINTPVNTDNQRCRILLVDDNHTNILVAAGFLDILGYDYGIAHNGLEALSVAAEERFDLVFMDMEMPEMDGLETTRLLRARKNDDNSGATSPMVPVIAITGYAGDSDRQRCLHAGMNDYMVKPYQLKDIETIIKKYLVSAKATS